jgi:hypothetical protein
MKSSLLEKRIALFYESTTELLTDIHARNNSEKGKNKSTSNKKRRMKITSSIPDPDMDSLDEEHFGL